MPKPGDRVIIEGTKLGHVRREGELLESIGSLLKIRWTDGSESLLTPGAGTVRFTTGKLGGRGTGGKKAGPKVASAKAGAKKATGAKAAGKAKGKTAAKAASKKPAAKAAKKKK